MLHIEKCLMVIHLLCILQNNFIIIIFHYFMNIDYNLIRNGQRSHFFSHYHFYAEKGIQGLSLSDICKGS